MGDGTGINWTDATWNPIIGCRRVSAGCVNCYAESDAARTVLRLRGSIEKQGSTPRREKTLAAYSSVVKMQDGEPLPRWNGNVHFDAEKLVQPLLWSKPRMIFVNSMSDLFHESVSDEQIAAIFGIMAATPRHTYQILTKRPERAVEWFSWLDGFVENSGFDELAAFPAACWAQALEQDRSLRLGAPLTQAWPLRNVWLGVSVENQSAAESRIPLLLKCPAVVRWISAEPLLMPVDFVNVREEELGTSYNALSGSVDSALDSSGGPVLDWVVVGGESGHNARPCYEDWIRRIVRDCAAHGTPVWVKQLGGSGDKRHDIEKFPEDLRVRQWPRIVTLSDLLRRDGATDES